MPGAKTTKGGYPTATWPGINPGRLRHQVQIQSAPVTVDAFGESVVSSWSTIRTTWAEINAITERELYQSGALSSQVTHVITVRWTPSVTIAPGMQVLDGAHIYRIQAVYDLDSRNLLIKMLVLEIYATSTGSAGTVGVGTGSGGNTTVQVNKYTVTFGQFSAFALTGAAILFSRAPRQKLVGLSLYVTTPFSGPGITALTATVGDTAAGSTNYYNFTPFNVLAINALDVNVMGAPPGAGNVTVTFNATGGNLSALTAGAMDIVISLVQQP